MAAAENPASRKTAAVVSLLTGATVWGIVWYPYRVLESQGLNGIEASFLTYLVALAAGFLLWWRKVCRYRVTPMLVAVGLTAGVANLGYVVATLFGEVTRVLLLFYLAPLWTVLLAWLILGEKVTRAGILVISLSLAGAVVMLWHPALGLPWPEKPAEWLGLVAGFFFSLTNVLIKKSSDLPIELKTLSVFVGVLLLCVILWPFFPVGARVLPAISWLMLGAVGITLVFTNAIVQYGLIHTAAAQAIVIMLFELVVAAAASWVLAGETLSLRDWLGGALIVSASLMSIRLEEKA